jgi:hypothetical protein
MAVLLRDADFEGLILSKTSGCRLGRAAADAARSPGSLAKRHESRLVAGRHDGHISPGKYPITPTDRVPADNAFYGVTILWIGLAATSATYALLRSIHFQPALVERHRRRHADDSSLFCPSYDCCRSFDCSRRNQVFGRLRDVSNEGRSYCIRRVGGRVAPLAGSRRVHTACQRIAHPPRQKCSNRC